MLSDTGCAQCAISGLLPGTLLCGPDGWRDVSLYRAGDWVQSLQGAPVQLRDMTTRTIWMHPGTCPASVCPVQLPPGAVGNQSAMTLLPDVQLLLVPRGGSRNGLPPAVIRAADLHGFRGIHRVQPQETGLAYLPLFDDWHAIGLGEGAVSVVAPPVLDPVGFIENFDRTPLGNPDLLFPDMTTAPAYLDRLDSAGDGGQFDPITMPRVRTRPAYRA